jgi:hypothetical protein
MPATLELSGSDRGCPRRRPEGDQETFPTFRVPIPEYFSTSEEHTLFEEGQAMRHLPHLAFLGTMIALASGQDSASDKAALRARITVLKKQLPSADEAERMAMIKELGEIDDDDAIAVLAAKLRTDSKNVRVAAAQAIARHRKPASAQALGTALDANAQNPEVLQAFIDALVELDVCKGLPVLFAVLWMNKNALAGPALDAIGKIGCPEAAVALVDLLRKAEAEEKKPDVFEDDEGGTEENRNKNKALAAVAEKTRETMAYVAGRRFATAREWSAWLGSERSQKLTSVYFCEAEGTTFEVPSGKPRKCAYPQRTSVHNDILLKHVKE